MTKIGPYDTHDAANADGVMELGIYCRLLVRKIESRTVQLVLAYKIRVTRIAYITDNLSSMVFNDIANNNLQIN